MRAIHIQYQQECKDTPAYSSMLLIVFHKLPYLARSSSDFSTKSDIIVISDVIIYLFND